MCECKECKVVKVRTCQVRVGTSRNYIFFDDQGRRWNGNQCPECRAKENLFNYHAKKRLRAAVNPTFGPSGVIYPPKLRRCPSCSAMSANYFNCPACTSHAGEQGCFEEVGFADMVGGRVGGSKAGWLY